MSQFIGRYEEMADLKGLLKKRSASLVVIRGRRRIGKSRLAEEYSSSFTQSYFFSGVPPAVGLTAKDQRAEFARQMSRQHIRPGATDDWGDLLADVANQCSTGRTLVVLDEISWMGSLDSTFLPKLKTVWDMHFKKNSELVLLISGSNSAWIEKNILSSTGFLGRISYELRLRELPLNHCNEFWGPYHERVDPYEKFKMLAVTGGVPRYLEEIRSDLTAEQNILRLCYRSKGLLFREYDRIFSDLFSNRSETYQRIIRAIAGKSSSIQSIANQLERKRGGDISHYLRDLIEAGFVSHHEGWNIGAQAPMRKSYFSISDNYVRFYIKHIHPYKTRIAVDKVRALPRGWKSIMGLQFENLVAKNAMYLFSQLGLNADEVVWDGRYIQTPIQRRAGCQVDYLIQTKHRVIYLCEVKFSEREIPYSVVREASERAARLMLPRGFSIRHVLIHVNGVCERLEYDEFFSHIVPFGALLGAGEVLPAVC